MRFTLFLILVFCSMRAWSQDTSSELSKWTAESESPSYSLTCSHDTIEIISPKGFTLWRNERMSGNLRIEYDACLVDEGKDHDRVSDLNCFWMASDPQHPDDIMARRSWRKGVFTNCYSLRLYYMGYGGNSNSTTRFRRYTGDERGIADAQYRPSVLKEYTDTPHLNRPNRWRHICITCVDGRTTYDIDGERIVDFTDPEPLRSGWFAFRTTWSHTRLTGFKVTPIGASSQSLPTLSWIGLRSEAVSFGVPFDEGKVRPNDRFYLVGLQHSTSQQQPATSSADHLTTFAMDFKPLAYWADGSVKWAGLRGRVDSTYSSFQLKKGRIKTTDQTFVTRQTDSQIIVSNGSTNFYFARQGSNIIDSIVCNSIRTTGPLIATCIEQGSQQSVSTYTDHTDIEESGENHCVIRVQGHHGGLSALPYTIRFYITRDCPQVKVVHNFTYDRDETSHGPQALGLAFAVPLQGELYNRHVLLQDFHEPVQLLVGRRILETEPRMYERQMQFEPICPLDSMTDRDRTLVCQYPSWDGYRMSQLNDLSYTIRKRAKQHTTPWIGTLSASRSNGNAMITDLHSGLKLRLEDFWQSYPSSIQIDGTTSSEARIGVWFWSPEAEPMDLRHYDTEAHGLEATYEDVQPGMSTPYGIGRTTELTFEPFTFASFTAGRHVAEQLLQPLPSTYSQLACSPEYLHDRQAFGVWSLPNTTDSLSRVVETRIKQYADYFVDAVDRNHWYGFWNYGDVMHGYDNIRDGWRYDIGGYGWDNTELASNMLFWYNYLRTGRADLWRMSVAMTRHTADVDVYHAGPFNGLGSRHNVSHWGCGAKEARISQALWQRFYYYLSGGDEHSGDLMTAQREMDTLLYRIDPMRLAEPRDQYPCSAPARLRIGPDWMAYAGNWMTEWERTGNRHYRDKILRGMHSVSALPNGIFTGNKALGYDPATGIISYEGDPSVQNTNHLLSIMGGFEMMNEMLRMLPKEKAWAKTWLDFCAQYKEKAETISKNRFRISRLSAYAYLMTGEPSQLRDAWRLMPPSRAISTNDAATWTLDAIYLLEVLNKRSEK